MIEILILGGLVILFNILDSVTTEWFLDRSKGDGLKTQESNPFARGLLLHHPILAHALKQGSLLLFAGAMLGFAIIGDMLNIDIIHKDIVWGLSFLATLLGLAVLNNAYIGVMKWRTGKRWLSPYTTLARRLKLKDDWVFPIATLCNTVISVGVSSLIVRL